MAEELEGLIWLWEQVLSDTEFLLSPAVKAIVKATLKTLKEVKGAKR